jgi:transcriptional regulator with XRE-family HTH domain
MNPSDPPKGWRDDAEKIRLELRDRVRRSSLSQRQIEENAGWSRGYLSQVLQGHITLTVAHLLALLEMLELPVDQFFASVLGATPAFDVAEIRQKLARYDEAFEQLRRKGLIEGSNN